MVGKPLRGGNRPTVARLIYPSIMSLDGYVADRDGRFDWAVPDEEVHTFVNELTRPIGTFLLGRRMYEALVAWESLGGVKHPPFVRDFAEIWRGADKVVYSRTLETVRSARTRIERDFDPKAVRRMKAKSGRDITVGGPELAGEAFRAGLVDELQLLVMPVLVGGGKQSLPEGVRLDLDLVDEHRFAGGAVFLYYRVKT
jgi:dihydrofolate reductase